MYDATSKTHNQIGTGFICKDTKCIINNNHVNNSSRTINSTYQALEYGYTSSLMPESEVAFKSTCLELQSKMKFLHYITLPHII